MKFLSFFCSSCVEKLSKFWQKPFKFRFVRFLSKCVQSPYIILISSEPIHKFLLKTSQIHILVNTTKIHSTFYLNNVLNSQIHMCRLKFESYQLNKQILKIQKLNSNFFIFLLIVMQLANHQLN